MTVTDEGAKAWIEATIKQPQGRASLSYVTKEFWAWVLGKPDIMYGLFFTMAPVPDWTVGNLFFIYQNIKPEFRDKYVHVHLGVSFNQIESESFDNSDLVKHANEDWLPSTKEVADYIDANQPLTLFEFFSKNATYAPLVGLKVTDFTDKFIDQVGFLLGYFPRPVFQTFIVNLNNMLTRLQAGLPSGSLGPYWPIYPLENSPFWLNWPLRFNSIQEDIDWVFDSFNGKHKGDAYRPLPAGEMGYGFYSWDFLKLQVRTKRATSWRNSIQRMWYDGGQCIRLSLKSEFAKLILGRPAFGLPQVTGSGMAHRALMAFDWSNKTNQWTTVIQQGMATIEMSTTDSFPFLPVQGNARTPVITFLQAIEANFDLPRFLMGQVFTEYLRYLKNTWQPTKFTPIVEIINALDSLNINSWIVIFSSSRTTDQFMAYIDLYYATINKPNLNKDKIKKMVPNCPTDKYKNGDPEATGLVDPVLQLVGMKQILRQACYNFGNRAFKTGLFYNMKLQTYVDNKKIPQWEESVCISKISALYGIK